MFLGLRFIRPPDPALSGNRPTFRTAIEGLLFIRRTPILLAAISLDLFAVLFGGAVALLPAIAEDRLDVGELGYGFLPRRARHRQAALMAVGLAFRPMRRHIGRVSAVGRLRVRRVDGGARRDTIVRVSRSPRSIILAGADMVSVYIRGALVPLVTPDEKRGRVLAVENVFIGASNELGAFESGIVAQAIGTPATVIGGGIATIAIVRRVVDGIPVAARRRST